MRKYIPYILLATLILVVSVVQVKILNHEPLLEEVQNIGATLPIAGSTYTLAGSGITSSGSSITLQSFTIPQNGYKIQDSDLSDTFYITLEPGSKKKQEIASCTTATQNANDTATLSGCTRGLSPITPFTASSSLKFAHAGGSQVIFSDPPQLFNEYVSIANTETISGQKFFDIFPEFSDGTTPTTTNQFATKGYADNLANQGAATSTESIAGIAELATRIESASSTAWGVNDPHVQQSQHATSTPSDNAFTDGVVWDIWSENDGKLSQLWLDLTESWTFSGALTMTASSTMASTSMQHLIYDGIDADALFRAGSADDLHIHELQTPYDVNSTTATSSGTTEANLRTHTITGGQMGINGIVKVNFHGLTTNSGANNTFIGASFGGRAIGTTTLRAAGDNYFSGTIEIYNRGSNTSQWALIRIWSEGHQYLAGTRLDYTATSTEISVDTTVNQDVVIQGDNNAATLDTSIRASDVQVFRKE